MLRQGRGAMQNYITEKPIITPYNYGKLNRNSMRVTGAGLTGLSLYYFYKKSSK